jgi:hypothetical protein
MKSAYNYTVLRYVHDTATGEFVNVGVVLYSPATRFASAICRPTYGRVSSVFPGLDGDAFKRLMRLVQARLEEVGAVLADELLLDGKPDSVMTLVNEILPADDSSLQWSPPGGGITSDPSKTLDQLYSRLVTHYDEKVVQARRSDDDVWRIYKKTLESRKVLKHLKAKKIVVQDDEVEFPHAWKNGVWHCLEPLSFDLANADSIRSKAHNLLGRMLSIRESSEPFKLYLLLGEPQSEALRPAFERAIKILHRLPVENQLVRETQATEFTELIASQIEGHAPETAAVAS